MDIFNLNRSKLRKKLLQLYFDHPEKKYYLRELERILDQPVANLRRELMNLEKGGIFKREVLGKQVYFFLDTQAPTFVDLKGIVSKTIGIEAQLKNVLVKFENIEIAFIFGSYAGGTEDALSDIDLMLVIIDNIEENDLIVKISKLEKKIDREINYHIFSKKEFSKKAKESNSFIAGILRKQKIFLIGEKKDVQEIC